MTCHARQYSDQMMCGPCALQWDVNDPHPPRCQIAGQTVDEPVLAGPVPDLPRVVAFAGKKRSGKDTAAEVLIEQGYQSIAFADGLKVMLRALLAFRGCPEEMIDRLLDGDLKEEPTRFLSGHTARHAMQTLGTAWGRDQMMQDFWVDTTEDRLKMLGNPPVVITDVRRQNEADYVASLGGAVYRIARPGLQAPADEHISERLVGPLRVAGEILNTAPSADEFKARVKKHLIGD